MKVLIEEDSADTAVNLQRSKYSLAFWIHMLDVKYLLDHLEDKSDFMAARGVTSNGETTYVKLEEFKPRRFFD